MEKFYLSKALLKMAGRGGDAFPTSPPGAWLSAALIALVFVLYLVAY